MATEYPEDNLFPGSFDSVNSSGRIISQKTFPTFDVLLSSNDYLKGETIRSDSSTGIVDGWDNKTNLLRASTNEDFVVGELIVGETSKTQGIASSITTYDSYFDLNAISTFNRGWQTNSGYLNDNLQRVQDSDYYQNFSYSLKSRIPFDTWNESVSALTHTTGFKKFSDLQIESTSSNITVGLSTDLTTTSLISDLIGYGNLNCVYDFDLVKENSLNVNEDFAVAVSGGPDSLALAFLAKIYSIKKKLSLKILIVDHKLRPESTKEANITKQLLKKISINADILNWKGKKPSKNVQSIARKKRYELLFRKCDKYKIKYILLGHHQDDLLENFFIRILRGSGLKGLISLDKKNKIEDKNLLRPLLDEKKENLIFISKNVFNFYIEDPTNKDEKYKRIMIRGLIKKLQEDGLDKKKDFTKKLNNSFFWRRWITH